MVDRYLAAYEAHDAAGCAALYAGDGEVHSPFGPPARGRAEIEAEHLRWFEDGETNKTMRVIRAAATGDLGYCLVTFAADVPGENGGVERFFGTSLNVMTRDQSGGWAIAVSSLNETTKQGMDLST